MTFKGFQHVNGGQILLAEGKAREVTLDMRDDFLTTLDESEADTLIKALTSHFVALADRVAWNCV